MAYYIAKFSYPFTDFRNLINILNKHDVDTGPGSVIEEYQNDISAENLYKLLMM
jgi:hypothetical protein